jgi:hypothetical protein
MSDLTLVYKFTDRGGSAVFDVIEDAERPDRALHKLNRGQVRIPEDPRIKELGDRLKIEQRCNHCDQYHGKDVCQSLLDRIKGLEEKNAELEGIHQFMMGYKSSERIAELEDIINKATVDPDAESTGEPQVDNSYTGQIAKLQSTIKELEADKSAIARIRDGKATVSRQRIEGLEGQIKRLTLTHRLDVEALRALRVPIYQTDIDRIFGRAEEEL